ncbi:MAG: permease [Deltaproteobacteria bacterium]
MLNDFLFHLWHYAVEVVPALAVGFFLSGLAHEFIPECWVDKYLGRPGLRPILLSTLVGTILPICCWGSLPVAVGFHKKGARLGPVLAFLVATPATSISALAVTYALLGLSFAVFIFFAVILMGLVIGLIGNGMAIPAGIAQETDQACPECREKEMHHMGACEVHRKTPRRRVLSVLRYAYIEMPRDIGLETLIGLFLAAAVVTFVPIQDLIRQYLTGGAGYVFSLVFGLLMYICSTATVPLADAFIRQGLSVGAAMVLMLAGPVTSYGTILVLRKKFGGKILFVYLAMVSIMALLLGLLYAVWVTGQI